MVSAADALRERRLAREFAQESVRAKLPHLPHPSKLVPRLLVERITSSNAGPIVPIKRPGEEMAAGRIHANSKRNKSNLERRLGAEAAYPDCRHDKWSDSRTSVANLWSGVPLTIYGRGEVGSNEQEVKEKSVCNMGLDANNRLTKLPQLLSDKTLAMAAGELEIESADASQTVRVETGTSDVCDVPRDTP